ncbi:MAG: sulfatase-like hydrolase/transferase [Planctomycetes bacterium]|nr:sulfatase-like hydrolase/transferase [Planctomycetota bacterium]
MNRREFLRVSTVGMSTIAMGSLLSAASGRSRKTNIILIMADDLGYECLSCYGSKDYRTPNLDKLAETGIRFEHCYSQPLCTPSRAQIMTGRYNQRNYEGFGYLNPKEATFANRLKEAGYSTCIAGKWQLCGDGETVRNFGFDEHCLWNMLVYKAQSRDANSPKNARNRYWAPVLYSNGKWTEYGSDVYGPDVCCDFICSFIDRHKDKPWLVYYPMILPHSPFPPTPDSRDRNSKNKKRNFGDMVEYIDKIVGRLLGCLEKGGLRDDTVLLFTGDNGTHVSITTNTTSGAIKGGKSYMTDAGTRVPFIAAGRGVSPNGKVCDDLIDFSDFMPTLCEIAGAELPTDRVIDGRSFLPRLMGKKANRREWIFCHYWGYGRNKAQTKEFVRDKRWKLYDDGRLYDLSRDVLEKSPLKEADAEAIAAKKRLQKAFAEVRLRQ